MDLKNLSDHDLLIRLHTKMGVVIDKLKELNGAVARNTKFRIRGYVLFGFISALITMVIIPILLHFLFRIV